MRRIFLLLLLMFVFLFAYATDVTRVACVGNSITYGSGIKDREKDSYPAQLQRKLGSKYIVGNFGKPGATLLAKGHRPYINQEEYKDAIDFNADIVVIHLGVNDTDPRDWSDYRDEFVGDYVSLVNSFRNVNPKVRVIIAGITPIWDRHPRFVSGTKDWQDDIREKIAVVADACEVELIDFYTPLYKYPFMFPDAIHPNEEGASVMAGIVYSAITGNYGGLKMPEVYSDNMVLQRDVHFCISGTSDAGDDIEVIIDGERYETVTNNRGEWRVSVNPLPAKENIELSVSNGSEKIVFKNVAVGEVWLCSGQSNMEFMLKNSIGGDKEIKGSAYRNIRLFDMKANWNTNAVEWAESALDSVNHLDYYKKTMWKECNPDVVKNFSAVAYYFGKMLQDSLGVTVGLICNAVGGSTTESWIDRNTLETEFHAILKDWKNNDFIQKWARNRASFNINKSTSVFQRHPYEPCYLYEAGIIPLKKFPIKGVVWYQGESNAHNMEAHEKLFGLLVGSWRKNWDNDTMPFYYVQLSSLNRPSWPSFRDSQRRLMYKIPYSGMVVSSDYGDSLDVHPINKRPVGERLARWALSDTYGYDILPSGPLFKKANILNNKGDVSVCFDYSKGLTVSNDGKLIGFELAEYDGLYYHAEAEIHGDKVVLNSPDVKNPKYVRYGWKPFSRANLVNQDGLPASTFKAVICDVSIPIYPIKHGVSAPFAGMINGCMVVAGGCNFPKKPAADGGKKVYYDGIYAIDLDDEIKEWKHIGKLPHAVAYGATVTIGDAIYMIGGENSDGALSSAYKVTLEEDKYKANVEILPSIPETMTNLSGTAIGDMVYISGGVAGSGKNSMYSMSVASNKKWKKLPSYPGARRVQGILLGNGRDELYLAGGFQSPIGKKKGVLSDNILKYDIKTKSWKKLTDFPYEVNGEKRCLVGGSGVLYNDMLVFTGGVNYSIFKDAINGNAPTDYMKKPVEWYKFNDDIIMFSLKEKKWTIMKDIEGMAKAGGVLLERDGYLYMICGETKPGIRCGEIMTVIIVD